MIVISGALVLVALVLLIIGVVSTSLPFVYASIAVSLVSLVFLVIGILQRRGETAPAAEGTGAAAPEPAQEGAEGVTAVIPSQGSRRISAPEPAVDAEPAPAESADDELELGGTVLVVAGRPRYHVGGCRYLTGKSAEPVDVLDAREEGFTPCGVCKPDDSLEQAASVLAGTDDETGVEVTGSEPADGEGVVEEDVPGVEVPAARRAAAGGTRAVTPAAKSAPAKAPRKSAAKAAKSTAAKKAPAKKAPARKAAAEPTAAPAKAVKAPSRTAAAKAASSRAASAAAASAPAAAKRPGSVVVIPDRGKFHTPQCRFVRDADDTEVLSKSAASRQGYTACGVCKP